MNKAILVLVVLLLVRSSQSLLGSTYEHLEFVNNNDVPLPSSRYNPTYNQPGTCKMIENLTLIGDVSFIVVRENAYIPSGGYGNQTIGVGYTDFSTGCTPSKEYSCGTSVHFKGLCPYYYSYGANNATQTLDYCDCLGTLLEMTKELVFSYSVSVRGGGSADPNAGQFPLSNPAIFTYKLV